MDELLNDPNLISIDERTGREIVVFRLREVDVADCDGDFKAKVCEAVLKEIAHRSPQSAERVAMVRDFAVRIQSARFCREHWAGIERWLREVMAIEVVQ